MTAVTECELGLAWIVGTFIIGMSFGACVGTVVAGLCRAAAVGDSRRNGGRP
jgi:hypothetical protein